MRCDSPDSVKAALRKGASWVRYQDSRVEATSSIPWVRLSSNTQAFLVLLRPRLTKLLSSVLCVNTALLEVEQLGGERRSLNFNRAWQIQLKAKYTSSILVFARGVVCHGRAA